MEIYNLVWNEYFNTHRRKGNQDDGFIPSISVSFICLICTAIKHALYEWRSGVQERAVLKFGYPNDGGKMSAFIQKMSANRYLIDQFDLYMDFLANRSEDYRQLIVDTMKDNIQRRRNFMVAAGPIVPPPAMIVVNEEEEIEEMRARLRAPRQVSGTGGLTINVEPSVCTSADNFGPRADAESPPIVVHEDDLDEEVSSALGSVSLLGRADDESSDVTVRPANPPQSSPPAAAQLSQGLEHSQPQLTEDSIRLPESISALMPSSMNDEFYISNEAIDEATEIDWK